MDETRKTMKQPPEPPKDKNGRPMAPPDGKVAPPDGIRPQRPEGQVTESVSESTASAETTEE